MNIEDLRLLIIQGEGFQLEFKELTIEDIYEKSIPRIWINGANGPG